MHERLREVAAQLALADVVFLGEQAGRAAGGAVALEPAHSAARGRRVGAWASADPEAAEQEGSLGLAERAFVGLVAVAVAVLR